jgi:[ribosomal protein S5]-alanine N-acetyltransferase
MKLETKRLILRPAKKKDWKDILEGAKDLEVSKMLGTVPHPYKKKDAEWFVNDNQKKWRKKEKTDYTFFIELKSGKKVIGATGIHKIDKVHKTCITGSWINKKYWRNGYILEAKVAILDFIFNNLKLRKVTSEAFSGNLASQKMSEKLGFTREGLKRKEIICKATGKIEDEIMYGLLKEEWKKHRQKIVKEVQKKWKEQQK